LAESVDCGQDLFSLVLDQSCSPDDSAYPPELRKGVYHGQSEIPSRDWRREIRHLFHTMKKHISDVEPPELHEHELAIPADAWKFSKY
jgi:hypothetical protein